MSCTKPLYRIPVESENFKLLPKHEQKREKDGGVFFFDILALQSVTDNIPGWNQDDVQVCRCGQCKDCRLAYSRDWAVRCSLEASLHEHNYFVTLTYDDYSLPRGEYIDYLGDLYDSTLCRRDIQLFIKNLREWERTENNNTGIKVFYCGEYGGQTSRPHFHICIFGCSEIPDLTTSFKRGDFQYYKSAIYEGFWCQRLNGIRVLRGFVDISEVSFDTVAYTARYCMKKIGGKIAKDFMAFYSKLDPELRPDLRLQPFVGMSLKPGIAASFYEDNKLQIYSEDLVKYQKAYDLHTSKPPRYFDKLFDREDPDGMAEIKERRRLSGVAARKAKLEKTGMTEYQLQQHHAKVLEDKEKKYVRSL